MFFHRGVRKFVRVILFKNFSHSMTNAIGSDFALSSALHQLSQALSLYPVGLLGTLASLYALMIPVARVVILAAGFLDNASHATKGYGNRSVNVHTRLFLNRMIFLENPY